MNTLLSLLADSSSSGASTLSGIGVLLVYAVIIGGFFYFVIFRPQKKQQTNLKNLISSLETGDSVLTTSGFYGVVIDINDDVVIVEFGNNKNCRIPMQKSAIVDIEKAKDGIEQ